MKLLIELDMVDSWEAAYPDNIENMLYNIFDKQLEGVEYKVISKAEAAPELFEAAMYFINLVQTGRAKSNDSYLMLKKAIKISR